MGMRQEAGNWRTAVKHKLVLAGREDQPAVKADLTEVRCKPAGSGERLLSVPGTESERQKYKCLLGSDLNGRDSEPGVAD